MKVNSYVEWIEDIISKEKTIKYFFFIYYHTPCHDSCHDINKVQSSQNMSPITPCV
jgi:hypothetical protein